MFKAEKKKLKQYCKNKNYELWEIHDSPGTWRVWIAKDYEVLVEAEHTYKDYAYELLFKRVAGRCAIPEARRVV